jgi:hypothetical protein
MATHILRKTVRGEDYTAWFVSVEGEPEVLVCCERRTCGGKFLASKGDFYPVQEAREGYKALLRAGWKLVDEYFVK